MMQRKSLVGHTVLIAWLALAGVQAWATSPIGGAKAPPFQPEQWVNQEGPVPASTFQGRLVLVERWATWCGPCVASIPHLNRLTDEFGQKGLTIVGITAEPPEKVKAFLQQKGVKYMVGSGGADGYVTRGIPHAWLVSPKGTIVWEGYPTDLRVELIQEHLRDVTLSPRFELPKTMQDIEDALNKGRFGSGLRSLKAHSNGADSQLATIARETADKVMAYGQERLQRAEDLIGQNGYGHAAEILADLTTSFHGTEIADHARTRQAALRQDPRIRVELEGEELLARADELAAQNRHHQAAAFAEQIIKSKKYDNSNVRKKAQQFLASASRTPER